MDVLWRFLEYLKQHEAKTISEAPLSFILFVFIGAGVGAYVMRLVHAGERADHEAATKSYEAAEKSHAATVEAMNQRLLHAQELLAAEKSRNGFVWYYMVVVNGEVRFVQARLEESGSVGDAPRF